MMFEAKTLYIGILGFGTVGKGVWEVLDKNSQLIAARLGRSVKVKKIWVRDKAKLRELGLTGSVAADHASDVLSDPDISIVVEVLGGENPAFRYICEGLTNGKAIVTANKEVIAKHKGAFFSLAEKHGVPIRFEAAVGGGIPIIRSLNVGYAANKMTSLIGILNGTTNYILTRMEEEQKPFGAVLKEAQKLGFAEADPKMDVSGLDSAYKLSILAAVAFKVDVPIEKIDYEGIEKIELKDMQVAQSFGRTIKLLAIGRMTDSQRLSLHVYPVMLEKSHPLASVRNEFNAIFLNGNAMGESMLYGKGAGGLPTASAIVSDILEIGSNPQGLSMSNEFLSYHLVSEGRSKFYLRLHTLDHFGVLEKIAGALGRHEVSISTLVQKDSVQQLAEIVLITHDVQEDRMKMALRDLEKLSEVRRVKSVIRVGLA